MHGKPGSWGQIARHRKQAADMGLAKSKTRDMKALSSNEVIKQRGHLHLAPARRETETAIGDRMGLSVNEVSLEEPRRWRRLWVGDRPCAGRDQDAIIVSFSMTAF